MVLSDFTCCLNCFWQTLKCLKLIVCNFVERWIWIMCYGVGFGVLIIRYIHYDLCQVLLSLHFLGNWAVIFIWGHTSGSSMEPFEVQISIWTLLWPFQIRICLHSCVSNGFTGDFSCARLVKNGYRNFCHWGFAKVSVCITCEYQDPAIIYSKEFVWRLNFLKSGGILKDVDGFSPQKCGV